jgi:hypothetical protein
MTCTSTPQTTNSRRLRIAAMTLLAAVALSAAIGTPAGLAAEQRSMDQFLFWHERLLGFAFPDGTAGGAMRLAGQYTLAEGMSDVDPSRAPHVGEPFYLQVTYDQTNPRPEMAFSASPTVRLSEIS